MKTHRRLLFKLRSRSAELQLLPPGGQKHQQITLKLVVSEVLVVFTI